MKCSDIITILGELAPEQYAESWDNPGLLVGRRDKSVSRLMVVLDVTDEAVDYAVTNRIDMIVSHHPLIFSAMKRVTSDDFIGRRILKLVKEDISVYAMHTNFDSAPRGMGAICAEKLGIEDGMPLDDIYTAVQSDGSEISCGIGMIGMLKEPCDIADLCAKVKAEFGLDHVRVFSSEEHRIINCAAICPGAGRSVIDAAVAKGAEVLVTGDIGHHDGIDSVAKGMIIIDADHYGLEHVFTEYMEQYLEGKLSAEVEIRTMPDRNPIRLY